MERIDRYADLIVRVGANVQQGQTLFVTALVEHAPLARALARAGYRAGARLVDVRYADNHLRRAFIESAPEDELTESPPWLLARAEAIAAGGALIMIGGDPEPELLADLDQARVGKARPVDAMQVQLRAQNERKVNWSIAAFPTEGQAQQVFGEPDVERLWEAVAHSVRLDDGDPVQAWQEHSARLRARCEQLDARAFDAIRFSGPGTDLTVGLLPGARWTGGGIETVDGVTHVPNLPTEEVFACPDWRRTEGTVRSTRPLQLGGTIVRDLEVRFAARRSSRGDGVGRRRGRAGPDGDRRVRHAPRRGRARRRRIACRADRHHVLRHALRRERHVSHRLRLGRHLRDRRHRGPGARRSCASAASTSPVYTPTS